MADERGENAQRTWAEIAESAQRTWAEIAKSTPAGEISPCPLVWRLVEGWRAA
jgi:hypothetical protein